MTRRFMQVISVIEVEVVDPVQVETFNNNVGVDEVGNIGMESFTTDENLRLAVDAIVGEAIMARAAEAGLRARSMSSYLRAFSGEMYAEFTIPEFPAPRDDGSYPGIPA